MIMVYTILLGIVALCGFDLMINQYQQQGEAAFLFWGAMVLALAAWVTIDSLIILISSLWDIWQVMRGKRESNHPISIPTFTDKI